MRLAALLLRTSLALLTLPAVAAQQPADSGASPRSSSWREFVTPDLIVAGNAPTGELKRMLIELTRFRDTLTKLFPDAAVDSPVSTWVVVLRDFQAFQRFQPRDGRGRRRSNVGGYFARKADVNFIVLPWSRGDYDLQTIFHEYTHYVVSRNVRRPVPPWLNEGLAEYYSTFRGDYRGRTLLGAVPDRARALLGSRFVPLRDIVSPRDWESLWRGQTQIGMFYAESWALVHYIMVERKSPSSDPLGVYLTSFARSGNHDSAFMEAFGTDVDGMDKELREYVRRMSLSAVAFDVQAEEHIPEGARSMSEADVDALEGRLLLELGADDEAERELMTALEAQPAHAAARTALARLRLRQEREDEAIVALQQVVASNPEDGGPWYYLGTALERAWRHEEALAAFSKAIYLMPRNPAPWSGVSSAALGLQRDDEAAAAVENALQVEWSPEVYWTQGLHALRLGRDAVAATSFARYLELGGAGESQAIYPLFILALAAKRAGRPADADAALANAGKGERIEKWTLTVLRFLQGGVDEAQLLRVAGDLGEQTEARTYVGFKLAMSGREDEAMTHFRWVADRGARNYVEYELAKNELNRLKYRNRTLPAR